MNTSVSSPSAAGGATRAADAATRVRVWDVPTRVFHWTFALCFAGAWLTSDSERLRDLHVMLGYTFAGLAAFRVLWGLVGTRYARFASFIFSPRELVAYVKSLLAMKPRHYLGHNPAGAIAIFAMLGLAALIALSGFATYQDIGGEWLEELHEGAASTMLAIVFVHIAGVGVSSLLHRENLVRAMLTGNKPGTPAQGIRQTHRIVGAVLLAAVLGFWWSYQTGATDAWLPQLTTTADRHHDAD
ncbi:cytochrome b/b6 domain-containing protein [Aromatoleum petrolei]|uniref:Cytochrome B n=1 Tax=Aromatoleum petrolei TaxID=76116 RepID=A0ABX1N162_9RHOO|nr:cytochrome b/b6 domain-containing protein [Aromatoleum petrolei]NMF91497.1 cytochrome B [Aromatoleum petrolei]QTQ35598.1 Cytochrome b561 family protein [Aromatoleum petrolei]